MNYASAEIAPFAAPAARAGVSRLTVALALLGMMALCVLLSVFFFMPQSLRLDEAQSIWQASRTPLGIISLVAEDVHVPLYHEILHLWMLYGGQSVTAARALSLVFYLLSLPAIYLLGREAYSRRVGLAAALLMAVSPFMNWYGNEVRMYTLFLLLTILNQYFFIRIWKRPSNDVWVGYAVTALCGVFTHYFFFLNLASQAIFYFAHRAHFARGSFRRFATILALVLITFGPWAWYVLALGEAQNQTPLLSVPTTVDVFNAFSQFLIGFQNDNVNTIFLSLWPTAILFGFLALRPTRRPLSGAGPQTRYFLITVVVSFAIAFGFSIFVQPVFVSRYLIFTVPSLYLLIVGFFDTYFNSIIAPAVLVALMAVTLAVEIASPTTPVKENYEQATAYLNAHVAAQDAVALAAPFIVYPVEYYYRGLAPLSTLPAWNQYAHGAIPAFSAATMPSQVQALADNHQNVWLLLSYDQGYNETIKTYFDDHYTRLLVKNFSSGLTLYEYQTGYETPLLKASPAMR
ncbi:MAG: glycosyltransferase family 39 protein [Minisyncoccia bacterium]